MAGSDLRKFMNILNENTVVEATAVERLDKLVDRAIKNGFAYEKDRTQIIADIKDEYADGGLSKITFNDVIEILDASGYDNPMANDDE